MLISISCKIYLKYCNYNVLNTSNHAFKSIITMYLICDHYKNKTFLENCIIVWCTVLYLRFEKKKKKARKYKISGKETTITSLFKF